VPEVCFVLAPRQNHFFVEIVEALRHELDALDIPSTVSRQGFPPLRRGQVYVLVPPHEFRALAPRSQWPSPRQLERTLFYCFEQPGSHFFDEDVRMSWGPVGAVLDVNAVSVQEFRRNAVRAHHAPLGWTKAWSYADLGENGSPAGAPERDIDLLHLGIYSPRRGAALARYAPLLQRWRTRLVLGDDHGPNAIPQANFAMADEKWRLLTRSRVVLNVHVGERAYFEWLRIVQAICNGALVVSEHSSGTSPLRASQHFVSGRVEVLGLLAQLYLSDEERRATMAREAFLCLKNELPFSNSARTLAELAEEVDRRPAGRRATHGAHIAGSHPDEHQADFARAVSRTVAFRGHPPSGELKPDPADLDPASDDRPVLWTPPSERAAARAPALLAAQQAPKTPEADDLATIRAGVKDLLLENAKLRRTVARIELELRSSQAVPAVELVAQTAAYRLNPRPRVSVLTALYNYEEHITRALDSVAASRFTDLEVIVVDDGSTDGSLAAARRWLGDHEDVSGLLVRHPVNRSLGPARNTALDFARGELSFVLDADNELYSRGIRRLVEVLDSDHEAAFAWGIAQRFNTTGQPTGLNNVFPWQPWRFLDGNYIDAMALWRTRTLRALGGNTEDLRLYGWEDFDLYCRVAESGLHGIHLPQIVGRYRVANHSMLSVTNLSVRTAVSLLVERHPSVLGSSPPAPA
jgi:hypothetical protein